MRAIVLALTAVLFASPAFAARTCLENQSDWPVVLKVTVEDDNGTRTVPSDEIPPSHTSCAEAPGRFVRIQANVQITWNNLPAEYKNDCPLPNGPIEDGDDPVYRIDGDSPKTASCEYRGRERRD